MYGFQCSKSFSTYHYTWIHSHYIQGCKYMWMNLQCLNIVHFHHMGWLHIHWCLKNWFNKRLYYRYYKSLIFFIFLELSIFVVNVGYIYIPDRLSKNNTFTTLTSYIFNLILIDDGSCPMSYHKICWRFIIGNCQHSTQFSY